MLSITNSKQKPKTLIPVEPPFPIPNLIKIQRESFKRFLVSEIKQSFQKINPLRIPLSGLEIRFFPEWIQCKKPEFDSYQAVLLGKTYSCSMYIPVLVTSKFWKKPKLEWVFLGSLPILTKQGHFLVNGISRVVLHQILRNPGVYILGKTSRTRNPSVRIVPERGSWINITIDKRRQTWIRTKFFRRKFSLLLFLQAIGFSRDDVFRRVTNSGILQFSVLRDLIPKEQETATKRRTKHDEILEMAGLQGHPKTSAEALAYIFYHWNEYNNPKKIGIPDHLFSYRFWFSKSVWNQKNRGIGRFGRKQFREKLKSKDVSPYLMKEDILLATQGLIDLVCGLALPDDIDNLNNKRIRGCEEFLRDSLNRGLRDFESFLRKKSLSTGADDTEIVWRRNRSALSKYVSKAWKGFFTGGTLSQYMDETNPLAEVTHKRRVTVLGLGGVSTKQTSIQIRGIHPTYYGRLCPIETPEGKNAGLVNSFALYTRRNVQGQLETPFFKVLKGQVQKNAKSLYLSQEQEKNLVIAPGDLSVSVWNTYAKTHLPVRKNWIFESVMWDQIALQSIGPLQMISVATSLIPFLEHDDANRALMGSNMQRQAVTLLNSEVPLVRTGLEARVISDVQHGIHATETGYITHVSASLIRLYRPKFITLPLSRFKKDVKISVVKKSTVSKDLIFRKKTKNFPSISSLSVALLQSKMAVKWQPPRVFGKTDGIGLRRPVKLSAQNRLTQQAPLLDRSFSKNIKNSPANTTQYYPCLPFCVTKKQPKMFFVPKDKLKHEQGQQTNYQLETYKATNQSTCRYHKPFVEEGQWTQKSSGLTDGAGSVHGKLALGKNVFVAYLPWEGYNFEDAILVSERLVTQNIFTSLHMDSYEVEVKNTQYGLEHITIRELPVLIEEPVKQRNSLAHLDSNGVVTVGTWVQEGDYLVGKITPKAPQSPSVLRQYEKFYRDLIGLKQTQVRNSSLFVPRGVTGFVLDTQILPPKDAEVLALAPSNEILRVKITLLQLRKIQVGDKMAGRHGNKGIISKIVPIQDMPFLPDGTPIDIVLNPLGVPSRMNVGQILEGLLGVAGSYLNESYTLSLFDEKFGPEASRSLVYSKLYEASLKTAQPWLFEPHHPGKIKLFDGRTGDCFDQPITVCCSYMLKLVHLVDDKIHARATGPYSAITQQPVRGRSRHGGQRLGEMEVWALQAYGAAATLRELFTLKSDDMIGRKQTIFRIYTQRSLHKTLIFSQPESFKVIVRELQSLCFQLNIPTKMSYFMPSRGKIIHQREEFKVSSNIQEASSPSDVPIRRQNKKK